MRLSLIVLLAGITAPVFAQEISECDWRASAAAIVEPWELHSRSFANGDVRLALMDAVEPAAGSYHLLLLSPPYGELGERQCRVLELGDGLGFADVSFDQLEASYDPAVGLIFGVPVRRYDAATAGFEPGYLSFALNQATGAIEAELQ